MGARIRSPPMDPVILRLLGPDDSLEDLTALLHRAYAELAARGFNYTASYQDAAATGRRCAVGECWLAVADGVVAGTATLTLRPAKSLPAPYPPASVPFLNQVGVGPPFRGRGIGRLLLDRCEERAAALGYSMVGLDTAEGATHLIRMYAARGYREIGRHRWEGKTYESVVMVKELAKESS